jgi:hypothetical protein
MQVFASLPNIPASPPDGPPVVCCVSELCPEMCVDVFGRVALLAEKSNDDSLVGLHPLIEKRKRTDLATIIRSIVLM